MDIQFPQTVTHYQKRRRWNRNWKRITTVLASVVVFITTYALILPAITLEHDYICGKEVHTHTDACYQLAEPAHVFSMICTGDTLGVHTHTVACYNEDSELICGCADFVLHTHNDRCFNNAGDLICTLPEMKAHTHDETCLKQPHVHAESCYIQQHGELICPLEEGSVHTHIDTCYIPQQNLICTLPETAPHAHTAEACYTETKELLCSAPEVEAHTHSDSCYTVETTQICALEELEGHAHGDGCFAEDGSMICDLPEIAGYTHTDTCFQTTSNFTCTLTETAGHVHGDICYSAPAFTLTCTTEETDGHTHCDTCYETVRVVTCALEQNIPHAHTDACYICTPVLQCTELTAEEGAVAVLVCEEEELFPHTHESACFDQYGACVCGLLQISEHIHDNGCFVETVESTGELVLACGYEAHEHSEICIAQKETDNTLTADQLIAEGYYCGVAEHSHQAACFGENDYLLCTMTEHEHDWICELIPVDLSDVETSEEWETGLPELQGNIAADLIAVAQSQLGYEQSEVNYIIENDEQLFYSRYADWWSYGEEPYGDWNAKFVAFCLDYAGITSVPLEPETATWPTMLEYYDQWQDNDGNFYPIPADLVFFDTDSDDEADCVGIITFVDPENSQMTVIHERHGKVRERDYALDDSDILGYARIPGNEPAAVEASLTENAWRVIDQIDALPTYDEYAAQMDAYYDADDLEGEEAYVIAISRQARAAYEAYSMLSPEEQAAVTNVGKLLALESIWNVTTLELVNSVEIYHVNAYSGLPNNDNSKGTLLIAGGSVNDKQLGDTFLWWSAIVVDEYENGTLRVTEIDTATGEGHPKDTYSPSTANGFVLLVYGGTVPAGNLDVEVGDLVTVSSFDRTQIGAYTGTSYGTVTFSEGQFKPDKDNSSKLTFVDGADTDELIEVNLYDYGENINYPYNTDPNKNYPGFQQDNGTTGTVSLDSGSSFNFGNNITADLDAGKSGVTTDPDGDINKTASTYNGVDYGAANIPVSGAMHGTLINGYPALADGTSLQYLFHGNSGYADKKNSANINGLFQYDEDSGAYMFNSRENHAQFDAETNTFTLYEQIISPNFMMYPFGNFLPFNDIVHLSAQTSEIDRDYLESIVSSARYKYNAGYGDEYQTLATKLSAFIDAMDEKYPTGWAAADAMNKYFATAGLPASFSETEPELPNGEPLVDYLYSIDYDEETDFYFGMEMKMNFMMPKDGMTGNDTNGDGASDYPMVFEFSGDDDVWVYVDGILFLDLSGIHRHVGGTIDFSKGIVTYQALDPATGDVGEPYKTVTFAEILGSSADLKNGTFKDYTQHTFNFYYMERGAGSGVCRMNFNFPLLKQNTINVSKTVESNVDIQGDPDYRFQVMAADADGSKTEDLFIGAGVEYTIYGSNNVKIGTGTTDANGVFTLKAGQRAEFDGIEENSGKYYVRELLDATVLEQYGEITVSGESTTTSQNVEVGSDTFTGANSPVKDISDGTTAFLFTNHVNVNKLGGLSISKKLTTYPRTREIKYYDIEVTLDGKPLPVGTKYTVGTETREVATAGIITIAANETASISNILAGTQFTVQETSGSAEGYIVTYAADGYSIEVKDGKATGTIKTDANIQLEVTNSEKGASVTFPITKTVTNPDGAARDYRFSITEVDAYGAVEPDGLQAEITVSTDHFGETTYTLNFVQTTGVFYYRITEVNQATVFRENDQTYVIEVTVLADPTAANGATATITKVWKDGEEIPDLVGDPFSADFTNTLVGSLTLSKEVLGTTPEGGFTFEITLRDQNGNLVSGTFPASSGENVTFTDGAATVTMNAGESITISDIPIGATWTIEETNADGYVVTYTVNGGEEQSDAQSNGSITTGNTEVAYTNSAMYELPETGGGGAMAQRLMGSGMLLTLPILYAVKGRYRGRRVKGG